MKIQEFQIVLSCREVPPHWEWTEGHLPYNCSPSHDAAIKSRQGGVNGARPPLRRWRAAPAGGLLLPLISTSSSRLLVQLPANGTTPTVHGLNLNYRVELRWKWGEKNQVTRLLQEKLGRLLQREPYLCSQVCSLSSAQIFADVLRVFSLRVDLNCYFGAA